MGRLACIQLLTAPSLLLENFLRYTCACVGSHIMHAGQISALLPFCCITVQKVPHHARQDFQRKRACLPPHESGLDPTNIKGWVPVAGTWEAIFKWVYPHAIYCSISPFKISSGAHTFHSARLKGVSASQAQSALSSKPPCSRPPNT